jgi:predicted glutamine amidotransferase
MCGIFGVLRSKKVSRAKSKPLAGYIKDATIVGTVRGDDSTGMFQLRETGALMMHKSVYPGPVFVTEERTQALLRMVDDSTITIGHHRSATNAIINVDTAHPFRHTDGKRSVTGVHNGFISNSKYSEDNVNFRVDSDWAYYQIFKHGSVKGVASLEGAAALVWLEDDGLLRIYSNGKRTISWNYVKDENAMVLASEHQMLYWLAERNGVELEATMWCPYDDRIYVIDPENPREMTAEKLPKKKAVAVSALPAPAPPVIGQGWPSTRTPSATHDVRYTFQNKGIDYTSTSAAKLGVGLGEECEFFLSRKMSTSIYYNIVGEIYIEGPLGNVVDIVPAIMINTTADIKDNLDRIDKEGGQCVVRVIGTSVIDIPGVGTNQPCVIVNKPTAIIIGDASSLIPTDVPVYGNTMVSVEKFNELVKDGCHSCLEAIEIKDARQRRLVWTSGDRKPICPTCAVALDTDTAVQKIMQEQRTGTD